MEMDRARVIDELKHRASQGREGLKRVYESVGMLGPISGRDAQTLEAILQRAEGEVLLLERAVQLLDEGEAKAG